MRLRDALMTLAGAAWELRLNERTRQVCFVASGDEVSAEVGTNSRKQP